MGVTVAAEDQADLDPDDAERDPALDRLLPTANRQDDEVAAEFRRLTETGLRQRKAAALETSADLLRGDDKLRLDEGEAQAFLKALTDVRLVLGERMGLRTDDDVDVLEAARRRARPRRPARLRPGRLRLPHLAAGDARVLDAGRLSMGPAGRVASSPSPPGAPGSPCSSCGRARDRSSGSSTPSTTSSSRTVSRHTCCPTTTGRR